MDIDEVFKQIIGNKQIKKGKTYTYGEIKKIFKAAMVETIKDPTGKAGKELKKEGKIIDAEFYEMKLSMEAIIILHTLEEKMFKEAK